MTTFSTSTGLPFSYRTDTWDLASGRSHRRLADFADLRESPTEAMREHHRRRHQFGRFGARVTKHHALIARALLGGLLAFRLLRIDALRDVRRLPGQIVVDEDGVGVENIVTVHVADVANGRPHDGLVVELGRAW